MSKIFEQLYLGSRIEASDQGWLDNNHITHIVNCAVEIPSYFPDHFSYLNLRLDDTPSQSIYHVLERSFNFILSAIGRGGNVLVHCAAGISRSASMVIYFIMKTKEMAFQKALDYVRSKRSIVNPNQGFVYQLISTSPEVYSLLNRVQGEQDSFKNRTYTKERVYH